MDRTIPLYQALASQHHTVRTAAHKRLFSSRSQLELEKVYKFIKEENKDEIALLFVNALSDILMEFDEDLVPWATNSILSFVDEEKSPLSKIALEALENFFSNVEVFNHFKTHVLSKIWPNVKPEQKVYLTKIIRKNKFPNLSYLLVQNFDNNNDKLILETIRAFSELNESRGSKYLNKYLKSSSYEIRLATIIAIGNIGNYGDSFAIQKFLSEKDKTTLKAAITSFRKLRRSKSLTDLLEIYRNADIEIKEFIIRECAHIHSKASLLFLINAFRDSSVDSLNLIIENSILVLRLDNKARYLINEFNALNTKDIYNLLHILDEVNEPIVGDYLLKLLDKNEEILVKSLAIDLLSSYPTTKVIETLNLLYKSYGNELSVFAFNSLLKIESLSPNSNILKLMPEIVEETLNHHAVYMKYLNKVKISDEFKDHVVDYLLNHLKNDNTDNLYSALSTLKRIHNGIALSSLLSLYNQNNDDYFNNTIFSVIRSIIYKSPYLLSKDILKSVPENVFKYLNPVLISDELLIAITEILTEEEHDIIQAFVQNNKDILETRVSKLIESSRYDSTTREIFIRFSYKFNYKLSKKAVDYAISLCGEDKSFRINTIEYILENNSKDHISFIMNNFNFARKESLTTLQAKYLNEVL